MHNDNTDPNNILFYEERMLLSKPEPITQNPYETDIYEPKRIGLVKYTSDLFHARSKFRNNMNTLGITKSDDVIVCVSGGPDSMGLLLLCMDFFNSRENPMFKDVEHIHVLTVNHGLRPESKVECDYVRDFCKMNGLHLHSFMSTHPEKTSNVENCARNSRIEGIRDVVAKTGISKVLTGHHIDDNAETFVMNMISSPGLEKRRSINWKSNFGSHYIYHPVLSLYKRDLSALCIVNEVDTVFDESNNDTKFLRNRVRHELMPVIDNINPSFKSEVLEKYSKKSNTDNFGEPFLEKEI